MSTWRRSPCRGASGTDLDPRDFPRFSQLSLGAPLRNASRNTDDVGRCSLGCFVYLDTGEIGFVTTGHSQESVFVNRGDTVAWSPRLYDKEGITVGTALVATELSKSRLDDLVFNIMDISLVRLLPGVSYSPGFVGKAGHLQIGDCIAPSIGDRVFKMGAATAMTEGTIVSVKMRLHLNLYNPVWFEGAFEVEGEDGKLFSNVGDSGAIIFKQVNDTTAAVVGMIFAGGGRSTYAFPLQPSLEALRCRLFTGVKRRNEQPKSFKPD
jgi:Peptidase family S64